MAFLHLIQSQGGCMSDKSEQPEDFEVLLRDLTGELVEKIEKIFERVQK